VSGGKKKKKKKKNEIFVSKSSAQPHKLVIIGGVASRGAESDYDVDTETTQRHGAGTECRIDHRLESRRQLRRGTERQGLPLFPRRQRGGRVVAPATLSAGHGG
jgi:hypothetical protein